MLILFSGGCDSTYLALCYLSGGMEVPDTHGVRLIAICNDQLNQSPQAAARERIVAEFLRRGYRFSYTELNLTFTQHTLGGAASDNVFCGPTPGPAQPAMWLGFAIPMLLQGEKLAIGYVRGDDIWHYRNHVCNTFNSIGMIRRNDNELLFPLEWEHKRDIVRHLSAHGLLHLCWWCDENGGKPCGQCASCQAHNGAMLHAKKPRNIRPSPQRSRRNARWWFADDQLPELIWSEESPAFQGT